MKDRQLLQDMNQALSCLDSAATHLALNHAMKLCSSSLGFECFLVLMTTMHGSSGSTCRIVAADVADAFSAWCQQQTELMMRFVQGAIQRVSPTYSVIAEERSARRGYAIEFAQNARTFGFRSILTAHQQTSSGVAAVCILLSSSELTTFESDWAMRHASLVACHAHDAALRLGPRVTASVTPKAENLSEAERTCLTLRAQGYDAVEIAAIMDVSPRTVTYYLYRAMLKLGARRPAEAVTKALMGNQISTFDLSMRAWDQSDCFINVVPKVRHPLESLSSPAQPRSIESARSLESLATAVADTVRLQASAQFAFTSQVRANGTDSVQFVITNYGEEYQRIAHDQAEVRFNPMFGGGCFRPRPFSWAREQRKTESCHLRNEQLIGVTAMVRSPGRISVLSLIVSDDSGTEVTDDLKSLTSQLVRMIHDALGSIDARSSSLPSLTELEISCLSSLASGQGLKNAADVLQCSTRMARYHMEKVARKLGTTTIAEGVARATELGLLPIARPSYSPHEEGNSFASMER